MKKTSILILILILSYIGAITLDLIFSDDPDSVMNQSFDIRTKIIGIDVKNNMILIPLQNKIENDPRVAEWIKISSDTKILRNNKKTTFNKLRYSQIIEIWLSGEVIKEKELRWPISIADTINIIDTNNKKIQMPSDFDFILKYGVEGKNILNTFEGTYTKDLVLAGLHTAKFYLTKEEMREIYIKMSQINVLEYPNKFIPNSNRFSEPHPSFSLEIRMNGQTKKITWNKFTMAETLEANNLRDLIYFIVSIIEFNPEYKELPEIKGGYM